jgi:putative endonuclease
MGNIQKRYWSFIMENKTEIWFVYIIRCSDNTLYTGITNSLEKRMVSHNQGKGAKYTRGRGPVQVVHLEEYPSRSEATKRESAIKKLTTIQKEKLIQGSEINE